MLTRADVNDKVKSSLGFPFTNSCFFNIHLTLETMTESQFCVSVGCDGFRKSVSGRIDSSASVPLSPALFLLSLSPSFRLSLSFCFSPSFSKLWHRVCRSTHSERIILSSRHHAYFMFMRSRKNLHMCKLPFAGSRSPIVKYAWDSHLCFGVPLYKPDTFVRALHAQVRCVHYLHTSLMISQVFSDEGFVLNFLRVAWHSLMFLHSSVNHGLLCFEDITVLGIVCIWFWD